MSPLDEDELTTAKRVLEEALNYAEHDRLCEVLVTFRGGDCDCGLYELTVEAGRVLGWHS